MYPGDFDAYFHAMGCHPDGPGCARYGIAVLQAHVQIPFFGQPMRLGTLPKQSKNTWVLDEQFDPPLPDNKLRDSITREVKARDAYKTRQTAAAAAPRMQLARRCKLNRR